MAQAQPEVRAADVDGVQQLMALLLARAQQPALGRRRAPVHPVVADGDAEHFQLRVSLACRAMCQSRT